MTALKDKYDKEIEKINAILQKQQNNQTAIQERQNNTDELRDIIINAVCSENVYGEIVDKIIVYDDYMLVKLKYIDFAFELSLIHISEPTRRTPISYAVFCLKKKKKQQ